MHVFLKTVYMVTVMVVTGMMMVLVLVVTPDFHQRLSTGYYRPYDPSYSQFVMQSLDNPGVFLAEVSEDLEEELEDEGQQDEGRTPVKREAITNSNYTAPPPPVEYVRVLLDYGRPQHQPWAGQGSGCGGLRVGFARRLSLPRTALASFPGSGNTWLRYLLQGATGLFTGSVYIDRELAAKGFYGENDVPECGCTIVVKTHGYCLSGLPQDSGRRLRDVAKFQGRGVLLLRNPYDTLIAYRNYLAAGHLGVAAPSAFRGPDWAKFVRSQTGVWRGYAEDWITKSKTVLVVHYEHLLQDPRRELIRLLHFLRLRVEHRRLHCVLANLNGAFRRATPENTIYRLIDPFTPELHAAVESAISMVNQALTQRGLPPLPSHLYSYHYDFSTTTTPPTAPSTADHDRNTVQHHAKHRASGDQYNTQGNNRPLPEHNTKKDRVGQLVSGGREASAGNKDYVYEDNPGAMHSGGGGGGNEQAPQGNTHGGNSWYHNLKSNADSKDKKYGSDRSESDEGSITRILSSNEEEKVIKLLPWMKPR